MGAGSSSNRRVTVRLLGTDGVGKSTLIEVMAGFAARGGAGGFVPGGCAVRLKGVEIYILETHFSELDYGKPDADMWYLLIAADDGPMDLDGLLTGKGLRFDGVFFNKCDAVDYDDDLIDLVQVETRSQLYAGGVPDKGYSVFAGSVLEAANGQVEAGISALEEFLKDIVTRL